MTFIDRVSIAYAHMALSRIHLIQAGVSVSPDACGIGASGDDETSRDRAITTGQWNPNAPVLRRFEADVINAHRWKTLRIHLARTALAQPHDDICGVAFGVAHDDYDAAAAATDDDGGCRFPLRVASLVGFTRLLCDASVSAALITHWLNTYACDAPGSLHYDERDVDQLQLHARWLQPLLFYVPPTHCLQDQVASSGVVVDNRYVGDANLVFVTRQQCDDWCSTKQGAIYYMYTSRLFLGARARFNPH